MCFISKSGSGNFEWEVEVHLSKGKKGGESVHTISTQPVQGFNLVNSIIFSSSPIDEQQTRKKSEMTDKQTWKNMHRSLSRAKCIQFIKEQP